MRITSFLENTAKSPEMQTEHDTCHYTGAEQFVCMKQYMKNLWYLVF